MNKQLILLWGLIADTPLDLVYQELRKMGENIIFLDQKKIANYHLKLTIDKQITGEILTQNSLIKLENIKSVYVRNYDTRSLSEVKKAGENSPLWQYSLAIDETISLWLDLTSATVINPPTAMASNTSKPYQIQLIKQQGFLVPPTIVTTNPERVKQFWELHGEIIYKSISSVRSKVSRLTKQHLSRLENITWCPTQFQKYIKGQDYRVHVIGRKIFACQIDSKNDDYRYLENDNYYPEIKPVNLPRKLEEKCYQLCQKLGLIIAGIDLRKTPEDNWYCFEVNPSPGFSFYQQFTEQPIAHSLAQILANS